DGHAPHGYFQLPSNLDKVPFLGRYAIEVGAGIARVEKRFHAYAWRTKTCEEEEEEEEEVTTGLRHKGAQASIGTCSIQQLS
ncbi:hypothetical protein Q8A73_023214, partial [Channa argus]